MDTYNRKHFSCRECTIWEKVLLVFQMHSLENLPASVTTHARILSGRNQEKLTIV